ncbi:hypothetical protein PMIN06_000236 [Paraphaeosphaeria minitans]
MRKYDSPIPLIGSRVNSRCSLAGIAAIQSRPLDSTSTAASAATPLNESQTELGKLEHTPPNVPTCISNSKTGFVVESKAVEMCLQQIGTNRRQQKSSFESIIQCSNEDNSCEFIAKSAEVVYVMRVLSER